MSLHSMPVGWWVAVIVLVPVTLTLGWMYVRLGVKA